MLNLLELASEDRPYGAAAVRIEEPGWKLGDLIVPGMLISSGPDSQPYLVERVQPQDDQYGGAPCWGLSGWYAPDGVAQRNESDRWWLNGWVAVRYSSAPLGVILRPLGIYLYECPARDFCFIVIAEKAFVSNRAGQLSLF